MKNLFFVLFFAFILVSIEGYTQRRGFTDDFEDGSFELARRSRNPNAPPYIIWSTLSPGTYQMIEAEGVLKIKYSKTKGVGAFDSFTLTPPYGVNVNQNPHIQVKLKSSINTTLTLRPIYSLKPPTYEEIKQEIPGDNQWHTYTIKLYNYLYERFGVQSVDFYLGMGSTEAAEGLIELDDVRIGWSLIKVNELHATVTDGTSIQLQWNSTDPQNTGKYKIYRGSEPRFAIGKENLIGETVSPEYLDKASGAYALYYYKVIPIGVDGEVFLPSAEVRVETYAAGTLPTIGIVRTNVRTVKKYEKFEMILQPGNVGIHNPYDPEDIDIYAVFTAPDGGTLRINGFYDNYKNADTWKLRFSPNKTGEWFYQVFVNDGGRTGKGESASFNVIDSEHHGWIKPSVKNPHYFTYDDGTSYYALGVYSPWRNTGERFKTYAEHNANLFAIWDIPYGGFINETGIIEEELGKYNQEKLGRIDSLLAFLEANDIQLMYAIWPHDLFSETVWATQWDINPYNALVDVVDVYSDELVWEYQKKKYRYMIARYAHSRSMGIWELINEMNGTDGWKENRHQAAYDWVEKADKYFEENDPYNHPVTASFSGGFEEYRTPLYERNDVPNIHFYPAQGWEMKYSEDTLRSSMYNYAWASQRFWRDFEKPAVFGEAGADLAYYEQKDPNYHEAYHNAIWATLSNGLAGIPVWWSFRHLSDRDWDHLSYIADFVSDIDFANVAFEPGIITGEGLDAYGMASDERGFGWARSYVSNDISKTNLSIQVPEGKYQIIWYDTWEGKYLKTRKAKSKDGWLVVPVPKLSEARKDIGFKLAKMP